MTVSRCCNTAMLCTFAWLNGCDGGKPGEDTGIDVSDLLCAGLSDTGGHVLIPTRSTDGCDGAPVSGRMECPDCTLRAGQTVTLEWSSADGTRQVFCADADIDEQGAFDLGELAPSSYDLGFSGYLSSGATAVGYIIFEVCSDDVTLEETLLLTDDTW